MSAALARAVEATEIVQALRGYGVTQAEVGSVTGVSDRAVRGWARATVRPERYDRLTEFRDLVVRLSDSLTARGVGQWLHARNRLLDGARPVESMAAGHFAEVRRAAEAFIEGAYV